jgi:hypothetical protein
MRIEHIELDKRETLNGPPAATAANLIGQEAHPALAHVVDRVEQPGQRVSEAYNKLRELFHARLARTTRLGHRPVPFLPVLPVIFPPG